ncbi:MAG: hypothetical protein ABIE03_07150 [Patescibacteria group bacterium]|nr:hypothetical protein [Patescibacteria group bacterium]
MLSDSLGRSRRKLGRYIRPGQEVLGTFRLASNVEKLTVLHKIFERHGLLGVKIFNPSAKERDLLQMLSKAMQRIIGAESLLLVPLYSEP